jgi:hypothetical protein
VPLRSDGASSGGGRIRGPGHRGMADGGVSGETGSGGLYAGIDLDVPIYSDLSGGRRGMGMGMGHTSAGGTTAGEEEEKEEEERGEERASHAVVMPVIGKADEVSKSAGKFEGLQAAGEEAQAAAEARNEEAQGVDGEAQSAEDEGAQAVDDDAQEGLYAGASAVCGQDRFVLQSASNQPRARMTQYLRGHFTAAALDPKHPIGKLCVPFAADIVLHLKNRPPSSWTSTHLDQLSAAVNNFLRDAIFARLRVPLTTSALDDSVVEALWGEVEAGVYAQFSGPLRCAPRPCNTSTGLEP